MDYAEKFRWSVAAVTKSIVGSVLEEFRTLYRWEKVRDDKPRTALDIGFGDGSATVEVVKPFLPADTRLDGADKSEDMIRLTKNCYEEKFHKLFFWNIEEGIPDKSILRSYDHVLSFFCFQYISNQRQALRNIYEILKPNGNFTLSFILNLPWYNAIKTVSENPKWSSYMQDIDTMCFQPLAEEKFPDKVYAELMSECGFRNVVTKVDVKYVLFESWEKLEGLSRYVDPFSQRMPLEIQEKYFAAYFEALKQIEGFWTERYTDTGEFLGVLEAIEVLIAFGEKGSQ